MKTFQSRLASSRSLDYPILTRTRLTATRQRSRKRPDRVSPTKNKPFPTPKESANRARGSVVVAQDAVCEKIQSSRGGAGCRSSRVYARSRRCVTDDRSHPRMLLRPRLVPDGSGSRFERHRSSGLHRGAYPERGRFTACKPGVDAAGDAALTAASVRAGVLVDLWRLRRRHDVVQRRRTRICSPGACLKSHGVRRIMPRA